MVSFLLIMVNVSLGFLALQATTGRAAAWLRQELLMLLLLSLSLMIDDAKVQIKMLPTTRFLDLVLFVNKYYLCLKVPNQ